MRGAHALAAPSLHGKDVAHGFRVTCVRVSTYSTNTTPGPHFGLRVARSRSAQQCS